MDSQETGDLFWTNEKMAKIRIIGSSVLISEY